MLQLEICGAIKRYVVLYFILYLQIFLSTSDAPNCLLPMVLALCKMICSETYSLKNILELMGFCNFHFWGCCSCSFKCFNSNIFKTMSGHLASCQSLNSSENMIKPNWQDAQRQHESTQRVYLESIKLNLYDQFCHREMESVCITNASYLST